MYGDAHGRKYNVIQSIFLHLTQVVSDVDSGNIVFLCRIQWKLSEIVHYRLLRF